MKDLNTTENKATQLSEIHKHNFFESEKEGLELTIKKLQFLCNDYDPYQPDSISNESLNIVKEFDLEEYLPNPFVFTNHLLQILDKYQTQLSERIQ